MVARNTAVRDLSWFVYGYGVDQDVLARQAFARRGTMGRRGGGWGVGGGRLTHGDDDDDSA